MNRFIVFWKNLHENITLKLITFECYSFLWTRLYVKYIIIVFMYLFKRTKNQEVSYCVVPLEVNSVISGNQSVSKSVPETRSRGCLSQSGRPCVFPFFHEGFFYDGESAMKETSHKHLKNTACTSFILCCLLGFLGCVRKLNVVWFLKTYLS